MRLRCVLTCLALAASAQAHAACATSVAELRSLLHEHEFPLQWEETGMQDARPLVVTLDDRDGILFISFVKAGEGLLAEGPARICGVADRIEAQFLRETLRLGTAASWMLKGALRAGARVSLQRTGAGRLRIGTIGWTGEFVPAAPGVGLKTSYGSF